MHTEPDKIFGDSYKKAEDDLAPLVRSLGFAETEINLKAAKALSMNGVEVTSERIIAVKEMILKLSDLRDTVNPRVIAKMLNDGYNPVNMNMDELSELANRYRGENQLDGRGLAERLARYIAEANRAGLENTDAVVATYKMLNQIIGGGGAAFATALSEENNLTLGRLFELSKLATRMRDEKVSVDARIEDGAENATRRAADDGVLATITKAYNEGLVRRFAREAQPLALDKTISAKTEAGVNAMPIEEVLDELEVQKRLLAGEENAHTVREAMDKIKGLSDVPAAAMRFMKANEIPLTVANLDAVKKLMRRSNFAETEMNNVSEIVAAGENVSVDELRARTDDIEIIERINAIEAMNYIKSRLNGKNGFTTATTDINGTLRDVDIYVMSGGLANKRDIDILISVDTSMGYVSASIKTKAEKAHIVICSETAAGTETFKANTADLIRLTEAAGFGAATIEFLQAEPKNAFKGAIYGA